MTTTTDKLKKARAAYEAAQLAAEREEQERAARAASEQRQRDEAFLRAYNDDKLAQDVRQAQRHLRDLAATDPLCQALAGVYVAQLRQAHQAVEASGAAARLGVHQQITSRPANQPDTEMLVRLIADLGEDMFAAGQDSGE